MFKILKHRRSSYTGVGVVSIPVILLIVAMTAVGILSLSLANSQEKGFLAQTEHHTAYYNALARLEEKVAEYAENPDYYTEQIYEEIGDGSAVIANIIYDDHSMVNVASVQRSWEPAVSDER